MAEKEKPITRLGVMDEMIREYNETHSGDDTEPDGSGGSGTDDTLVFYQVPHIIKCRMRHKVSHPAFYFLFHISIFPCHLTNSLNREFFQFQSFDAI